MGEGLIRILVVDDHEVVRAGIVALLGRESDLEIVGQASSGEEALLALDVLTPDVVILDNRLPGMSGVETCREIVRRSPSTSVVMLTSFVNDDIIHAALSSGARGFLTKDIDPEDLPRTVRTVARGSAVLSPEVTERLLVWARQSKPSENGGRSLSTRELEVLSLVARGLSNREIARRLCVSEPTAKVHLHSVMRKLGTTRRWEAVAVGIEMGVI